MYMYIHSPIVFSSVQDQVVQQLIYNSNNNNNNNNNNNKYMYTVYKLIIKFNYYPTQ